MAQSEYKKSPFLLQVYPNNPTGVLTSPPWCVLAKAEAEFREKEEAEVEQKENKCSTEVRMESGKNGTVKCYCLL